MSVPADLLEQALALSTADDCVVIVADRAEVNLRWAGNSLTTNGQMHSRSMTVVSMVAVEGGLAAGVVSSSIAGADDLPALVAASEAAARSAGPAEDAYPLIGPDRTDEHFATTPTGTDITVFADFAPALGRAFDRAREAGILLYGFAEHIVTSQYLGTSTGLRRRFDQPTGRLELNAKSADLTRSAWAGVQTSDFSDIDIDTEVGELEKRLGWAANRIDLPAGRYETLLPPSAVADLMIYAYWTASARDAEEGRNVFAAAGGGTRVGEQLAAVPVTLRSDPNYPGLECTPFEIVSASYGGTQSVFDNGAELKPTSWIEAGVLSDLMRSRSWAARSGADPRPAIDNLILDGGGSKSLDALIASTERGLLLTCLWYIREVDPQTLLLTGLTRDGVYLIENGQVVGAVNNFRFNESPVGLLSRITEVGRTERTLPREWSDYFSRAAMPAVRVAEFNMSTVSDAS
jgi:predicted Zn-dependent protease